MAAPADSESGPGAFEKATDFVRENKKLVIGVLVLVVVIVAGYFARQRGWLPSIWGSGESMTGDDEAEAQRVEELIEALKT